MKLKLTLLPKVLISIVLGILCGLFFPEWAIRIFSTTNSLIAGFIKLFIPLLIIGLVSAGIAEIGQGAGKVLLITVAIAYGSTVISGGFSFILSKLCFTGIVDSSSITSGAGDTFSPYFTIEMPPFIEVTTALIISFILGITANMINGNTLKNVILDFRDVVNIVITKVIIPILPIYIYGIFLVMSAQNTVGPQLALLAKVVIIIFAMHITVLISQYLIAGIICKRNPFTALITMLPAYLTALGTSSSAATIPVTHAQTLKNGVCKGVADFSVPLCATIHMPCSILKIVACAVALMMSMDIPINNGSFVHFILMAGIAMVAAPGVPGGSIMAALGPLASILGFTDEMQGMMIALYIMMDSFGTAGNVTGDGAIAMVIDRFFGKQVAGQSTTPSL